MQLDFLRKRGCLEVQGRLFGDAMSAGEMTLFLKNAGDVVQGIKQRKGKNELNSLESKEIH